MYVSVCVPVCVDVSKECMCVCVSRGVYLEYFSGGEYLIDVQ